MFRVMQTTETGEVFCQVELPTEDDCWDWIEENQDQYPESTFFVEYVM